MSKCTAERDTRQHSFLDLLQGIGHGGHPEVHLTGAQASLLEAKLAAARARGKGGTEEPPDQALGRSRGGFGTKLHMVTDGRGLPLAIETTAGQAHASTQFETLMQAVRIAQPLGRPCA